MVVPGSCFRHPLGEAIERTESTVAVLSLRNQDHHLLPTVLTLPLDPFDIVDLGVVVTEKFVGFADAVRTVDALLVRGVVLELVATAPAFGPLAPTLPVAVVLARVGVATVAVGQPRFRIVEVGATVHTGPIGERLSVDFRVMLARSGLGLQRLPTGRTLGHTTGWPRYSSKTYGGPLDGLSRRRPRGLRAARRRRLRGRSSRGRRGRGR